MHIHEYEHVGGRSVNTESWSGLVPTLRLTSFPLTPPPETQLIPTFFLPFIKQPLLSRFLSIFMFLHPEVRNGVTKLVEKQMPVS